MSKEINEVLERDILKALAEAGAKFPNAYLSNFMERNPKFHGSHILLEDGKSVEYAIEDFRSVNPACFFNLEETDQGNLNTQQSHLSDLSPVERLKQIHRVEIKD